MYRLWSRYPTPYNNFFFWRHENISRALKSAVDNDQGGFLEPISYKEKCIQTLSRAIISTGWTGTKSRNLLIHSRSRPWEKEGQNWQFIPPPSYTQQHVLNEERRFGRMNERRVPAKRVWSKLFSGGTDDVREECIYRGCQQDPNSDCLHSQRKNMAHIFLFVFVLFDPSISYVG